MASKGQKFNKYTPEFISQVLSEYKSGEGSAKGLGVKYNVSVNTIDTWIRKYINHPELSESRGKRGRPKSNGEIDYKERYEILKKYQAFIKAQREKK